MKKSPAKMPFSHHGLRRGTIFHYYMIYLFLTGVLMTSAGLCLHTIMKADQVDSKVAIYLKTLTRLDQVFRSDMSSATVGDLQATSLAIQTQAGHSVRWSIDSNVINRQLLTNEELLASDRFVFPSGTKLSFISEGQFVVCRLQEAPTMPAGYEEAASQAKVVEIVTTSIQQTPEQPEPVVPEAASTNADSDTATPAADKQGDES